MLYYYCSSMTVGKAVLGVTLSFTLLRTLLVFDAVWEANRGRGIVGRAAQTHHQRRQSLQERHRSSTVFSPNHSQHVGGSRRTAASRVSKFRWVGSCTLSVDTTVPALQSIKIEILAQGGLHVLYVCYSLQRPIRDYIPGQSVSWYLVRRVSQVVLNINFTTAASEFMLFLPRNGLISILLFFPSLTFFL